MNRREFTMHSAQPTTNRAVVLLSGGLDSATTLAIAQAQGFECDAMSFRYGQRAEGEIDAADRVARSLGACSHTIIPIDLRVFGGSALTADIEVPKDQLTGPEDFTGGTPVLPGTEETSIPITYVPARNTIFLSFALAYAEAHELHDIFIGVNAVDYSGYPDCRAEFIRSFEATANRGTRAGVQGRPFTIHTPLIDMTKAQIIRRGVELGVEYGQTLSCYDPDVQARACGHCDSCLLRKQGFHEAGVADPTVYTPAEVEA